MKNQWKRTWLAAVLAAAVLLAGCFAPALAAAEGAEPYGDGDGIVSREQLAGLYNWIDHINSDFYPLITFDMISDALGKQGRVNEKDRDDYRGAVWTDGDKGFVTITFRNRDGSWGLTSVTATGMLSDEYGSADYSFLPPIGNRPAGSSATEAQTLKAKLQTTSDEVTVTAQVPVEYWTSKSSFGEARFMNTLDISKASGNSAGLQVSFWPDEASLQAEREKCDNLQETEGWNALGTTLKGYTYTRYGMDMTEYVLQLKDGLWMSLRFYECTPYAGSEAEAIVYSLAVEYGDFTWTGGGQPAVQPAAEPAPEPAAEPTDEPAPEPAPAADADGGYAGYWLIDEMSSDGETIRPGDYGIEMGIELQADGTAIGRLDDETIGTWSAEGNRVDITLDGATVSGTVEDGVMTLAAEGLTMKLMKAGAAAQGTEPEPEPTEEPAGEPTSVPAAGVPLPDAGEDAYVGEWHLIFVGTGGFTGNAADIGLAGEKLTLNADHTGTLTVDADLPTHQWRMEGGMVRLENEQRLILLREDILQYGTEQSGYMIFSKDPAAVWDGTVPMFDPFAQAEPEPTEAPAEPAPTEAPEAPQGGGAIQTEVQYTAKTIVSGGVELDASVLGGEYAITLHDGGSVDFTMAGTQVPGLLWNTDGDAVVIDYYGAGQIRITAEGDGIALDLIGSMILKMVP